MSNTIDIRQANIRDEELMKKLDAWVSKTEREEVRIPRSESVSVYVMYHGEEIAAVYVFYVEPVVAMFFDREGPAARTIRCFDMIRAVMQANGVKPLVFVDEKSPLRDISGKRMTKVDGREVFRM